VTQAPARKPYRRGEGSKLRVDIIAAAAALIEETGSEQSVTLREVARRIGIAAPSIYEHFPSREAIVYAVVDDCFSQFREALAQAWDSQPDPLDRLRAGCAAYLRFADQRPGQYRVLFGRHEHLGDRPPGRVAIWAEAFDQLVAGLRDCTRTGQITSDDPYADAVTIWAALHGYATLRASLPRFDMPSPQAALDRILSRYASAAPAPSRKELAWHHDPGCPFRCCRRASAIGLAGRLDLGSPGGFCRQQRPGTDHANQHHAGQRSSGPRPPARRRDLPASQRRFDGLGR